MAELSNTAKVLTALRLGAGTLPELADRTGLPTLVILTTIGHINATRGRGTIEAYPDPLQQTVYVLRSRNALERIADRDA
jgi:hypothetical protein